MYARTVVVRDVDDSLGSFHGLGLDDLASLLELRDAPGRRPARGELAGRLGVPASDLVRRLGPLERIGLVEREAGDGGARQAHVVLTEAGARVVEEALPTAEDAAGRALGRLPGGAALADALAGARPA